MADKSSDEHVRPGSTNGSERPHAVSVVIRYEGFTVEMKSDGLDERYVEFKPHTSSGYPEEVALSLGHLARLATIARAVFDGE